MRRYPDPLDDLASSPQMMRRVRETTYKLQPEHKRNKEGATRQLGHGVLPIR